MEVLYYMSRQCLLLQLHLKCVKTSGIELFGPLHSQSFTTAANHSNKPYCTKTDSYTSYVLMLAPLF